MDYLYSLILGAVEGVTEFLPISSTGHLILTGKLLGLPASEFWKSFEVAIQLGAILAVVVLYGRKFLISRAIWERVIIAFIPTGALGLLFYKAVKQYLLGSTGVVLCSLALGGVLLIFFEALYRPKTARVGEIEKITYTQAAVIGLFQSVAMIPGVSRAAATIVGGLVMGLSRRTIVEFSFLLAVPTMLIATGFDLIKTSASFNWHEWGILAVGFLTAFAVALVAIKFFINYIKNHSFVVFGFYRLAVAIVFWWLI